MPIVSVVFGLLLIALGVWGYWGGALGLWRPLGFSPPEKLSGTALIPAYVGAALLVLGLLAFRERLLKHAMHLASAVGLLGLAAAGGRLLVTGNIHGVGGASLLGMTLLCAVFVALCIHSFLQARRRRRAASADPDR
jgi:uncharacterized membrane protein YeaQ/YmgE (transglycosylase-associated protein family)